MNTLNEQEMAETCGGFEPLNDWGGRPPVDSWGLQLTMDQLARDQEEAFLRGMIMQQAD